MFSSTKRLIFTLIMGAVVLNSCVKDITDDLDDLQTADDTQDWIFPFINSDIQLEDIDSTNIKVYPDGTVYYSSIADSVIIIEPEDIFDLPSSQQVSAQQFTFDNVNTAQYTETKLSTLQAVLSNDAALWATLLPLNNTLTTIPSFAATNLGLEVLPPFSEFNYITYDNGMLDVKVSNTSNIPLTNVTLKFSNVITGEDLGTVFYPTIDPAGSATQQLNMAGKTIRNLIQYEVLTLESPGTTSAVVADFGSPLSVEVASTINMAVNTARAEFNDPIFDFSFFYELKDDAGNPLDQELTEIKLKSGTLQYFITANVTSAMNLIGEISGSTGPGGTIKLDTHQIPSLGPQVIVDSVDLAGYTIDLTEDPFNPFNKFRVKFSPNHFFPGLNEFDKADQFSMTFLATNVEFEYVRGRFGLDSLNIPINTVDWEDDDVFGNISGNVEIENSKINFISHTNIGADYSADLIGIVTDVNSDVLNMQFNQSLEISGPNIPDFGNSVMDNFVYDQTNSNADEVISFLPNSMTTTGKMYLNKNNPNRECYINDEAFMRMDVEFETPLHLIADTLFYTDTVSYDNEDFEDLKDLDTNKFITSIFLHMYVENDFPLDVWTTLSIIDSVDATTDTLLHEITYDDVIKGAKVDANGVTIEPEIYKEVLELSKEDRIALVNGDKILVHVNVLTSQYNATTPFVKLKADDHFKLNLSVHVENHIPVE